MQCRRNADFRVEIFVSNGSHEITSFETVGCIVAHAEWMATSKIHHTFIQKRKRHKTSDVAANGNAARAADWAPLLGQHRLWPAPTLVQTKSWPKPSFGQIWFPKSGGFQGSKRSGQVPVRVGLVRVRGPSDDGLGNAPKGWGNEGVGDRKIRFFSLSHQNVLSFFPL